MKNWLKRVVNVLSKPWISGPPTFLFVWKVVGFSFIETSAITAMVIAHEQGHAYFLRKYGVTKIKFSFFVLAAATIPLEYNRQRVVTPQERAIVALGGLASIGILPALILLNLLSFDVGRSYTIAWSLALFNLMPISFLDGGSVARSIRQAKGWKWEAAYALGFWVLWIAANRYLPK